MSATSDKTGSGCAENACADAGRARPLPCAGHGPSLQHGMPFCISYCRKEAKASAWKYADGYKKNRHGAAAVAARIQLVREACPAASVPRAGQGDT